MANKNTLYLYVMQYFDAPAKRAFGEPAREVIHKALYASNLGAAVAMMNQFYEAFGLGNLHKSLERNIEGITINGIYYPPETQGGN